MTFINSILCYVVYKCSTKVNRTAVIQMLLSPNQVLSNWITAQSHIRAIFKSHIHFYTAAWQLEQLPSAAQINTPSGHTPPPKVFYLHLPHSGCFLFICASDWHWTTTTASSTQSLEQTTSTVAPPILLWDFKLHHNHHTRIVHTHKHTK